jgi:tetratricopeptide (TPR) repeat protein
MACVNKGLTREYMARAQGFFERALALDPGNLEALVGTAIVDSLVGGALFCRRSGCALRGRRRDLDQGAVPGAESCHGPLPAGARPHLYHRADQGIAECERALALNRNLADAHAQIGLAKYNIGRGDETETYIREALRLSPRDTNAYAWAAFAGYARSYIGIF